MKTSLLFGVTLAVLSAVIGSMSAQTQSTTVQVSPVAPASPAATASTAATTSPLPLAGSITNSTCDRHREATRDGVSNDAWRRYRESVNERNAELKA